MPTVTGHTTAIRAGKAIGTDVYDCSGKKMGEVKDIVLEKSSNNVLFAVVSFGGVPASARSTIQCRGASSTTIRKSVATSSR